MADQSNNQIIATPPQPNHAVRLRAVELKHRLLRASRHTNTPEPVSPPASDGTTQPVGGDEVSPEYAEAINQVARLSPTDRVLLRNVAESDEKLANSDAPEQDGSDEQDEQPPAPRNNPSEA
jgi:hypothetical protein